MEFKSSGDFAQPAWNAQLPGDPEAEVQAPFHRAIPRKSLLKTVA